MPYKVKIERELSDEFLESIMVTMVESGDAALWYWATPISIDRGEDLNVKYIVVTEDEADDDTRYTIDAERVAEAIQKMFDAVDPLCNDTIMGYVRDGVTQDDAGCIDAWAADVISQVVCFGEVVYG